MAIRFGTCFRRGPASGSFDRRSTGARAVRDDVWPAAGEAAASPGRDVRSRIGRSSPGSPDRAAGIELERHDRATGVVQRPSSIRSRRLSYLAAPTPRPAHRSGCRIDSRTDNRHPVSRSSLLEIRNQGCLPTVVVQFRRRRLLLLRTPVCRLGGMRRSLSIIAGIHGRRTSLYALASAA